MLLNEAERALLRERGIVVFEKCDTCGKPLMESFCWKFAGKPEVYCSQVCRNGVPRTPGKCAWCQAPLEGKRRSAQFCGKKCRMRHVRANTAPVADLQQGKDSSNIGNGALVESETCEARK